MKYSISVIIPVYNTEAYLKKCIESILNQDVEAVQYIFIDDGSTDNSYDVIRGYANEDDRFLVLKKENGGQSSARNLGLKYAEGKYIVFVDSDDYIEANVFAKIVSLMEEKDLDILHAYTIGVDGTEIQKLEVQENESDIVSGRERLIRGEMKHTLCEHVYKNSLIKEHNILFLEGVCYEDMDFVLRTYVYAKRTMWSNLQYYYYVLRHSSTTQIFNVKKSIDYYNVSLAISKFEIELADATLTDGFFREYLAFMFSHVVNMCAANSYPIAKLLKDKGMRKDILIYIRRSRSARYRIQYLLLKCRFYNLYSLMYRIR